MKSEIKDLSACSSAKVFYFGLETKKPAQNLDRLCAEEGTRTPTPCGTRT